MTRIAMWSGPRNISTALMRSFENRPDTFVSDEPFYGLQTLDYVSILAITDQNEILLVQQYRAIVDSYTLELPSGHVEKNQTPGQAAKNELYEETGYLANTMELLGELNPDVGRLTNKLWCYLTTDISLAKEWTPEKGIEMVKYPIHKIRMLIENNQFNHALNLAVLYLAELKGIRLHNK